MTTVVNKRTHSFDFYGGRGSFLGNPWTHLDLEDTKAKYKVATREESIKRFREYFYERIRTDENFRQNVHDLKGKVLGCFCKPQSCHLDIVAEYLNNLGKRYFLDRDDSGHWYIVEAEFRAEWEAWNEMGDDRISWESPKFAKILTRHPKWVEFEIPLEK
jgi:hypothetical protein